MGRSRRSFTKEFKVEAVRLLTEGGRSVAQVARDLGIRDIVLGRWKQELVESRRAHFPAVGKATRTPRNSGDCKARMCDYEWNGIFKKKAAAIFSKDSL